MAETKAVRVVPSGKVYRQMFDAQVQLHKSLSAVSKEQRSTFVKEGSIPLVKTDHSDSFLTERQKTWVDGFPNDPYIENPVVYKQYTDYMNASLIETDSTAHGKEVRGLPDEIVPAKKGSDIIERIAESKKQRHEAALEDMKQELSLISSDLEPVIAECSEILMNKLQIDDAEINQLLARIEKDEDLLTFDLDSLYDLWQQVQSHSEIRQEWITEMDGRLVGFEEDRMKMIRDVFQSYSTTLEKISHMMSPDLHRYLDKEAQDINQTVLSNQRSYSDLYLRLLSADIEREKSQHNQWKRRVEVWRKLNINIAKDKFTEFMQSDQVVHPVEAEKVLQFMVTEQQILNNKRIDLINTLCKFQPPSSTKTSVSNWNQQVRAISEELDSVNQLHLSKLHEEYENVCQFCLEGIENVKNDLIERQVCSALVISQLIDDFMLPLVGERQKIFEENLAVMEKELIEQDKMSSFQLRSLFKYAQEAAHVWDVHEISLAKKERSLQEKLENSRHAHDIQNQDKEAQLDIIMDRMRQDSTEQFLKESLEKAMDMLSRIKETYLDFHRDQVDVVHTYPEMIRDELFTYDDLLCKFFSVERVIVDETPTDKILETQEEQSDINPDEKQIHDENTHGDQSSDKNADEKESSDENVNVKQEGDEKTDEKASSAHQESPPETPAAETKAASEVIDTIITTKGTHFNVLKELSNIKKSDEDDDQGDDDVQTTFITQTKEAEENKPEYVRSVLIQQPLLDDIQKNIRLNFINHLEEWIGQAMERAQSVVMAKCEELNSELDLRLHLHAPRPRRAELDVHNVRAAELVMHSERVSRHCKGVQQSLLEVRQKFGSMTQEHNKLAVKFRHDIEALEIVFVNATKSSRLVALQNQLSVELDKFMSVIRTSLRQFRQHLDETLQMLRQSNARFIKSFKVFSDGGNFCPDEIDEYRKRLEKMSQKIDSAEGSVMSDLEGMESKRLEQATKIAMEFEDRFKSHMLDLLFMEKIAHWLTNTQVKIKAEVADSNSQAQRLVQFLKDIERNIDACEYPNLDKPQVTPSELNESLERIFEAFHTRSYYLNCLKDPVPRPPSATAQGTPAANMRVGFSADVTAVSRPGKQPVEDPSVGVIKNILKTQKSKMRFGPDAEMDGDAPQGGTGVTGVEREKSRAAMSAPQGDRKSIPKNGAPGAQSLEVPLRRIHSGLRRSSKPAKFDKKYLVFGEKEEEEEETNFLGKIKRTLREALDGLLTVAELFYRQKGNRPVTRPQSLQESFEQCADIIVQKLQSYNTQAVEYHNQCLQELRGQLIKLENLIPHIPVLVIKQFVEEQIANSKTSQDSAESTFKAELLELELIKTQNKHDLRPSLGHPNERAALEELCEKEKERSAQYKKAVEEHVEELQKLAVQEASEFVQLLASESEKQFLQYDNLLTVDDVEKGRIESKKYPTSELIRRKNADKPLEDQEDASLVTRGQRTWTGIPTGELSTDNKEETDALTASVITAKTTLGHTSTESSRDKAYQDYKRQFESTLKLIEERRENLLLDEQRWTDNWNTSVEKVKQLYN